MCVYVCVCRPCTFFHRPSRLDDGFLQFDKSLERIEFCDLIKLTEKVVEAGSVRSLIIYHKMFRLHNLITENQTHLSDACTQHNTGFFFSLHILRQSAARQLLQNGFIDL